MRRGNKPIKISLCKVNNIINITENLNKSITKCKNYLFYQKKRFYVKANFFGSINPKKLVTQIMVLHHLISERIFSN